MLGMMVAGTYALAYVLNDGRKVCDVEEMQDGKYIVDIR